MKQEHIIIYDISTLFFLEAVSTMNTVMRSGVAHVLENLECSQILFRDCSRIECSRKCRYLAVSFIKSLRNY